jgi:hypothetical protein
VRAPVRPCGESPHVAGVAAPWVRGRVLAAERGQVAAASSGLDDDLDVGVLAVRRAVRGAPAPLGCADPSGGALTCTADGAGSVGRVWPNERDPDRVKVEEVPRGRGE